ncbi:translocation and assembly module lipoprotein TamL [Fibrella forsythiae]|uniref:BamA/TamA family outer membrane protein n=1 Tax=Fibrella forsythiae TaxID=2817061 RepID=A0ABS3JMN4_9BACT|nr:BamA/TamA family outer membrane protein [Fibrella forsythiae]MBO0951261.1 BamA/TamA family outer membrane protein [Fibrella forsythiae]
MKRTQPYLLVAFLTSILLYGCNVAKHLPAGEKLYVGTDFVLNTDSTITKDEKSRLTDQLTELARPRPNKQLFGFPYKVAMYYFIGEPKKEKGFRAGLRRRFGEAPVLASARGLTANSELMANVLENQGYFRSRVGGEFVDVNSYKTKARYTAQVPQRYLIDSVSFIGDSTQVARAMFNASPRTLLKAGDPFVLDVINTEKQRIADAVKQRGFYYFLPEYVAMLTDTAVGNHKVRFYVAIKPDIPAAAKVPYFIRNVNIFPNYTLRTARRDTNLTEAYQPPVANPADTSLSLRRFYIVDSARVFKPQLFNDVISLRPGRRYNSRAQDLSLSRLVNLGTFKYVRNRFEPVGRYGRDSALFDVNYYLTPLPRKSVRLEVSGNSRSNNLAGTLLTLSFIGRNFLGRAEQLTVNGTAGIDLQIGAAGRGVTNYRYGVDATLSFPRLVSPFTIRYDRRQILPKTNLSLGYELLQRDSLYNLSSFRASFGYAFRTSNRVEHSFNPLNVNFVHPFNEGPKFYEAVSDTNVAISGPYLRLDQDVLILSSIYTLNVTSLPNSNRKYSNRYTLNIEPAGNLAGLLVKYDDLDYKRIFGLPFSQFFRIDLDTRHYFQLNKSLVWANRFFGGVGIPYGNSVELPFVRQYFVGGANSVRAFRPRAVGPGTFSSESGKVLFQDGGGDVKLEVNTELRAKLGSIFQLATFIDAGNVWSYTDQTYYGPGSQFSKDFIKQLAIGGGIGLRLDLSYFLIRADLATPFQKPYLPEGQRWVLNQIDFGSRDWRRENLILNIAVGYPF